MSHDATFRIYTNESFIELIGGLYAGERLGFPSYGRLGDVVNCYGAYGRQSYKLAGNLAYAVEN